MFFRGLALIRTHDIGGSIRFIRLNRKNRGVQNLDHHQIYETEKEVFINGVFDYYEWKNSHDTVKAFRSSGKQTSRKPRVTQWATRLSYCRITPHCCQYPYEIYPYRVDENVDVFPCRCISRSETNHCPQQNKVQYP